MSLENPLGPIKNTRETYSKQLEKVIIEVQVQFADENPAWIPLDTLLAMNNMKGVLIE